MAICLMPIMVTDYRLVANPLVTASNASERGWAIVRSLGLTEEGRASLEEMRATVLGHSSDQIGLIELFGGIGGARLALELLRIEPGIHVYVEPSEEAALVSMGEWPEAIRHSVIEDLEEGDVQQWVKAGPHVAVWIVTAGFPCLKNPTTQIYQHIGRVKACFQKFQESWSMPFEKVAVP